MNTFGLGLVLSFVDNASSGMARASNAFQQMSGAADGLSARSAVAQKNLAATATALSFVGDGLVKTGSAITNAMVGIGKTVLQTGGEFFQYRMQLNKLYGGPDEGEAALNRIKTYAQQTSFTVEQLLDSVTLMKVVGIEAMDTVTSTTGKTTQSILAYASDLAAMMPKMRNVYGTGVSAAIGAFKEYAAEGNAITLARSAGLDIEGILGEKKAKDVQGRLQQIADLIEKLNIAGYTADMFGTPQQIITNLQDYWTNFVAKVSDDGVWEKYGKVITKIGNYVKDLNNDQSRYNALVKVLSGYVKWLLDIADKLADWVISITDSLSKWAEKNPEFVTTLMKIITVAGSFMIVSGVIMKIVSLFMLLNRVTAMFGITSSTVIGNFAKIFVTKMLPMAAMAAIVKYAWDHNLGAIQQKVENIMKIIDLVIKSFGTTGEGKEGFADTKDKIEAQQLGIYDFIVSIHLARDRLKDFFDGMGQGWGEVITWLVNLGMTFDSCAKQIFGVTTRVGEFLKGNFGVDQKQTFIDLGRTVGKVAGWITVAFAAFWVGSKVFSVVTTVVKIATGAFNILSAAISFLISPIGLIIVAVAALVAGFIWCYNNIAWFKKYVDEWAQGFVRSVQFVVMLFKESWDKIVAAFQPLIDKFRVTGGEAKGFGDYLAMFFQSLMIIFQGIWAVVVGVVNGIINALAPLVSAFNELLEFCMNFGNAIIKLFKGDFSGAWESFKAAWTNLGMFIYDLGDVVMQFIYGLWDGIVVALLGWGIDLEKIMRGVGDWFLGLWEGIKAWFAGLGAWFKGIWDDVVAQWNMKWEAVRVFFFGLWEGIKAIWNGAGPFFAGIWNSIVAAFNGAVAWFAGLGQGIWGALCDAWNQVGNFFGAAWQSVRLAFFGAKEWFSGLGSDIWNGLTGFLNYLGTFFSLKWENIRLAFFGAKEWFTTLGTNIWGGITGAFNAVGTFFGGIWSGIQSAFGDPVGWFTGLFSGVWKAICDLFGLDSIKQMGLDFISGFVQGVGDTVTAKIEEVKGFFGQIWTGVLEFFGIHSPSTVAATAGLNLLNGFVGGISDAIGGAVEKVKAFFGQIWDAIKGIFGGGGNQQTDQQKSATEMGTSVVNGIAGGLSGSREDAENAAREIGNGMLTALRGVFGLGESSTYSPVAETLSKMIVEGLKTGFSGTASTDFDAAAQTIIDSITKSLETKFSVKDTTWWGKGAEAFKGFGSTIIQGIVWGIEDSKSTVTDALSKVGNTNVLQFLTGNEDVLASWKTLCSDILSTVTQLQTDIASKVTSIANTFSNITWKLPKIKLPKINVTWSTNAENIKIPSFSVTWNKKGAIFDTPTIFNTNKGMQGVGEAGREAVIPISELWSEMTDRMRDVVSSAVPAAPVLQVTALTAPLQESARTAAPVTNNNSSSSADNRIVFEEGAIQMHLTGTTQQDADKFLDKIMKQIERRKQIKGFASYSQEAKA